MSFVETFINDTAKKHVFHLIEFNFCYGAACTPLCGSVLKRDDAVPAHGHSGSVMAVIYFQNTFIRCIAFWLKHLSIF